MLAGCISTTGALAGSDLTTVGAGWAGQVTTAGGAGMAGCAGAAACGALCNGTGLMLFSRSAGSSFRFCVAADTVSWLQQNWSSKANHTHPFGMTLEPCKLLSADLRSR